MTRTLKRLALGLVVVGVCFTPAATSAQTSGSTVQGTVTVLGTIPASGANARFSVALSNATCTTAEGEVFQIPELTVWVYSGRTDGQFTSNAVNFKNAYSTVLVAFLTGNRVVLQTVGGCIGIDIHTVNLPASMVSIAS